MRVVTHWEFGTEHIGSLGLTLHTSIFKINNNDLVLNIL